MVEMVRDELAETPWDFALPKIPSSRHLCTNFTLLGLNLWSFSPPLEE